MPYYLDARRRLWRAETHREELRAKWSEFLDDEPYYPSVHVDDEGEGRIYALSAYEIIPPEFGILLGETLYHLRAALNFCVYNGAVIHSGQDPPPDEEALEFPICRTKQTWESSARKIRPLSDNHLSIIQTVQPCFAEEIDSDVRWVSNALGILHDWSRIDRHRRLNVLGSWGANRNPQVRLPPGTSLKWLMVTSDGFLEHDEEVARFAIEGWKPGMEIEANPDLTIDIAVNEEPAPRDDSDTLGLRLMRMHAAVEGIIELFEKG